MKSFHVGIEMVLVTIRLLRRNEKQKHVMTDLSQVTLCGIAVYNNNWKRTDVKGKGNHFLADDNPCSRIGMVGTNSSRLFA